MRISDWSSDVCSSDLGADRLQGREQFGVARRRRAKLHILLDRTAEQHRILPDEAELRAQIDRRMLAAVKPVDEDIARLGRVKPAEQAPERRLARRDAAAERPEERRGGTGWVGPGRTWG